MSMFQGNLFNTKQEFHSCVVQSEALEAIGISIYSRSSLNNFFKQFPREDIQTFFNESDDIIKEKLLGKKGPCAILYFDQASKTYKEQTGSDIFLTSGNQNVATNMYEFFDKINDFYIKNNDDQDLQEVIYKIQNSYSGCITCNSDLSILGTQENILIKLFVNDKRANDSRTLAIRGQPLIVSVPTTAARSSYSFANTNNGAIGAYSPPDEGNERNPQNSVAGHLKLTYNAGLKSWESGTQQVMVRILEDIDAPSLQNISNIEDIHNVPTYEFYDTESTVYLGNFTLGTAVTLSNEKGNPHMFGPNTLDGCNDTVKETITVVNRMPYSYKKNDIVICSQMSNEWIITTPGTVADKNKKKNNQFKGLNWSFMKMVANSDAFCREYKTGRRINYDEFERYVRLKFYDGQRMADDLTTINLYQKESKPNEPFNYFDDEDILAALNSSYTIQLLDLKSDKSLIYVDNLFQIGAHMGGNATKNEIGRTHVFEPTLADPLEKNFLYQSEIPDFWGCVLLGGYSSAAKPKLSKITSLQTSKYDFDDILSSGYGNIANVNVDDLYFRTLKSKASNTNILSVSDDNNVVNPPTNRMFSNTNDNALYHLPAELGLNGSLKSSTGFPKENIDLLNLDSISHTSCWDYLYNSDRYEFLCDSDGNPAYNLSPINNLRIQFSPLQIESAVKYFWKPQESTLNEADKAKMFSLSDGSPDLTPYYKNIFFGPETSHDASRPAGGPNLFPTSETDYDERSNVVGVIAAVQTIAATDSISFRTDNLFGLPQRKTVSGGSGPTVSFIPLGVVGVAFSTPGTSSSINAIPQWGSLDSDSYWSFGTTTLHVRVFDAWPREQTIYIPRFYSILHFNPGVGYYIKTKPSSLDSNLQIHVPTTPVDFRVPTASGGYSTIPDGTTIGSGYALWPESEWRIDTIRRGQLLTGGGFRYWRRYIGVSNEYTIISMPNNVSVGDKLKLAKDVEIEILSTDNTPFSIKILNRGRGFVPSNFATKHVIKVNGIDQTYFGFSMNFGNGGRIIFHSGMVHKRIHYDPGPAPQDTIKRLTPSSARGAPSKSGRVDSPQTTSIQLTDNPTRKYDAFYFFANDILHTTKLPYPFNPGYESYVILEVG